MSGWRHNSLGSEIDRSDELSFTFDGQSFTGFEGDTVASALLASGTKIFGRSFKYHRPRGLWGKGAEEPNAILDVKLGSVHAPNQRATTTFLQDGMDVYSVNAAPDAKHDRFGFMDRFHRFIPAGFYYKTFMALNWMSYEPSIRRMAGLGKVEPAFEPPADAAHVDMNCDLLVIGAGPAGLSAAKAATHSGRKVLLIDDAPSPGGSLRWRGGEIDGQPWLDYVEHVCALVRDAGGQVLSDTTLWGAFDHGMFAAWERRQDRPDRHLRIRANDVVLAAGAIERPLWFANNDVPGVMSVEAAMYHLNCHGAVAGKKILIATANDLAYPAATAFANAGVEVTLVDSRADAPRTEDGIEQIKGEMLKSAIGSPTVTGATIGGRELSCDTILCSGGYTPSVHIWCQAGGKLDWDENRDVLVPRPGTCSLKVVGAANGEFGLAQSLRSGHLSFGRDDEAPVSDILPPSDQMPVRPDPSLAGRQWIDMQNDVTLKDVGIAAREGYKSVEHLKRYTTLGMATDQGRTSNFAGLAAMAAVTGKSIAETGTTTYRPPFEPVPLAVIAGRRRGELFNPLKRLSLESLHQKAGARFREYGGWLRPSVYGVGDEQALTQDEARCARETVGIFDASPLGKLEIVGPKAAELLDFCGYIKMSSLKPGRARYGFMLSESGIVYDDGVVLCLENERFIVSASSSHVDGVRFRLEDARQDRFSRDGVAIHDVTQGLATLTVTGPMSRELLSASGIREPDLAHMDVAETEFNDQLLRIARISFTGDRSYELSVPVRTAGELHARLADGLKKLGGCWLGLEAVMILRAEKGYILVGKDTDGNTMPHDLGWKGPREKRKDEYLGKRSLFNTEAESENRRQLVGLQVGDGETPLVAGSHVIPKNRKRQSMGFVTSSYFSPSMNRPIALALVESGLSRIGEKLACFNDNEVREVTVVSPCAFDPQGERLNG
ncbi:MAG: 2Fe-2S iron-sulfur cluster-binding protein [Pseudomonadota bacterium]